MGIDVMGVWWEIKWGRHRDRSKTLSLVIVVVRPYDGLSHTQKIKINHSHPSFTTCATVSRPAIWKFMITSVRYLTVRASCSEALVSFARKKLRMVSFLVGLALWWWYDFGRTEGRCWWVGD